MRNMINDFTSKSVKDTFKFAKKLAKRITGDVLIVLEGDLGAGKTTFTKGFLKALNVKDIVTSPTFTLMNEYITKKHDIYHFDMYRINAEESFVELGLDEIFNKIKQETGRTIILVEWAENIKNFLPKCYLKINIEKINDTMRKFRVERVIDNEKCVMH